jgi:hypothetical protein
MKSLAAIVAALVIIAGIIERRTRAVPRPCPSCHLRHSGPRVLR